MSGTEIAVALLLGTVVVFFVPAVVWGAVTAELIRLVRERLAR